ncbi:cupin-like domain-containing protein [Rheinheimera baltica]|uniref:Cupin-like domain-containing protein n=1 Tax=Rheinheimera baltica TaxID=67576 RepID=A0ABT9I250_9GAMM|nr:cupin-like domain-containing protein [Rheinheimera baltica]MDP5137253.1 cupin-like domain-containing protein [Rheinheimera baltica]MDP5143709.1 cupin-like domain-containing protein [Rheinheimera baltica]
MMTASLTSIETLPACDNASLQQIIAGATAPLVFKQQCKNWPLVQAGLNSATAAADYLRQFYQGEPVTACLLPAEQHGRIFYNDDCSGFNFQGGKIDFNQFIDRLLTQPEDDNSTLYMGSTEINRWFNGLAADNSISLSNVNPLTSVWIGNQSRIAAHFDFPHNLACNVVGTRTFTLFPPDQIGNLYPGPMEFAPGGQDISMVDFEQPDFQQFPLFSHALEAAQSVTLQPGDMLFIPSMWWHHVKAHTPFNVLISHWWRDTPAYLGRPNNALLLSILSLRSLPKAQRQAWKAIFEHYIFDHDDISQQHIPEQAQGMLSKPLSELQARQLRADLLNKLKR